MEKKIRAGPGHDLDCYLGYVQQLNKAIDFLQVILRAKPFPQPNPLALFRALFRFRQEAQARQHRAQLNDLLQNHEAMRSTSAALKHTRALHAVALEYCLETFRQTLSENSIRPDFNEMASQVWAL